jgi:hypothetical protein
VVSPFFNVRKKDKAMEMKLEFPERSLLVALAVRAEPLRCWRNAALAVLQLPDLLTYIEGWIVVPEKRFIRILEHGWCRAPEIGIVDPSIMFFGEQAHAISYFPGFEIAGHDFPLRVSGQVLPLVCHSQYGEDGLGHQGYKQSYDEAWQHARNLAQERQLPLTAITVGNRGVGGITVVVEGRSPKREEV